MLWLQAATWLTWAVIACETERFSGAMAAAPGFFAACFCGTLREALSLLGVLETLAASRSHRVPLKDAWGGQLRDSLPTTPV